MRSENGPHSTTRHRLRPVYQIGQHSGADPHILERAVGCPLPVLPASDLPEAWAVYETRDSARAGAERLRQHERATRVMVIHNEGDPHGWTPRREPCGF
jgi:hypothetical protein